MTIPPPCELCTGAGGEVLVQSAEWRIVLVSDQQSAFPGYCRVIWQSHITEMTDLSSAQRQEFMQVVWQVESSLRESLQPHKINLASLGNFTPHLHWHVIPRWQNDSHFPHTIWSTPPRVLASEPSNYDLTEHALQQFRTTIRTVFA